MSDQLIEAGKKFNDAVAASGVVGGIRSDIANIQTDVTEVKADVKTLGVNMKADVKAVADDVRAIKTTLDRWGGAIAIASAAISIAVSLVVALLK